MKYSLKDTVLEYSVVSVAIAMCSLLLLSQYSLLVPAALVSGLLFSLASPRHGLVFSILFFPIDQLISGISPDSLAPGRYLILINVVAILLRKLVGEVGDRTLTRRYLFSLFILIGLGAVSLAWANDFRAALFYLAQLILLACWAALAVQYLCNQRSMTSISVGLMLIGAMLSTLLIWGDIGRLSHHYDRILLDGLGINSIATMFGLIIIFSLSLLYHNKNALYIFAIMAFASLMFFAIIKMGTRSAALAVPLSIVMASFLAEPARLGKNLYKAGLLITTVFAVFYISFEQGLISEKLLKRFTGLGEVSTYAEDGRALLAAKALEYAFFENPIGTGLGNEEQAFSDVRYKVAVGESHNTYLSTLVQLGFVGAAIFLAALMAIFVGIRKITHLKEKLIASSLLLYLAMSLMKASLLQTRLFWIPLTLILVYLEIDRRVGAEKRQPRISRAPVKSMS